MYLIERISKAISARQPVLSDEADRDGKHENAIRLFNGFLEGWPGLVIDLYARTLVIYNHADHPEKIDEDIPGTITWLRQEYPWIQAGIVKTRSSSDNEMRWGKVVFGSQPDRKIRENGIWYAIDLQMNQDASLYLDTRNLRRWAYDHLRDRTVLNTFAYTGSLGAAAAAGGASRVVHLDVKRKYLNLAKTTYTLNGLPIQKMNFMAADFFAQTSQWRREGITFACVFLDPPFFSTTAYGTVDLNAHNRHLINKVRPLIANGGWLIAINNALFVSGAEYMQTIKELCADGYLEFETSVPVPEDITGYPNTIISHRLQRLPTDPTPFNHTTKIAILRVRHKTG